jgi:hypothetical protein
MAPTATELLRRCDPPLWANNRQYALQQSNPRSMPDVAGSRSIHEPLPVTFEQAT